MKKYTLGFVLVLSAHIPILKAYTYTFTNNTGNTQKVSIKPFTGSKKTQTINNGSTYSFVYGGVNCLGANSISIDGVKVPFGTQTAGTASQALDVGFDIATFGIAAASEYCKNKNFTLVNDLTSGSIYALITN